MLRPPATLRIAGRSVSPFRACGALGYVLAVAVALAVAHALAVSVLTQAALAVFAAVMFLALAVATVVVTGRERLVYYHHEIAILGLVAALCALLGAPVREHLDATAIGLGVFLVFGRIGCALAGCCHGRPARGGLAYCCARTVPRKWRDVPLFPVQLLEAAAVLALVVAAVAVAGSEPGAAFSLYVTGYAIVRFELESLRGDMRPYWRGFSEAQWTSLGVVAVMTVLAAVALLPAPGLHVVALAIVTAMAVVLRRARRLDPRHVAEIEAALERLGGAAAVLETSRGLRISGATTEDRAHVTVSGIGARDVPAVAELIEAHVGTPMVIRRGVAGTYHVIAVDRRSPPHADAGTATTQSPRA